MVQFTPGATWSSETKAPPTTKDTSAFCAELSVENTATTSRSVEKRRTSIGPPMDDLRQRDDVNLHRDVFRQAGYFHRGTRRRRVLADFSIHLIHLPEFAHVFQEHRGLYRFLPTAARGLQDRAEVLQHLLGLRLDSAGNQVSGCRIERHLPGDKNKSIGLDGLRIRPDRLGRVGS